MGLTTPRTTRMSDKSIKFLFLRLILRFKTTCNLRFTSLGIGREREIERERERGKHDFGRLIEDVSSLYRIKKRKRRQTHLPSPFPLGYPRERERETSNPLYDSQDTARRTAAGGERNLRDVGGNFPASLSPRFVQFLFFCSLPPVLSSLSVRCPVL